MTEASGIAADRLRSFIERIERLEEEKAAIADDIKEVYQEAKSSGFETKIIRQVIKLRKMDAQERSEQEQLLDVYMGAIGMLAGTPLGEASGPTRKPVEGDVELVTRDPAPDAAAPMVPTPHVTLTTHFDGSRDGKLIDPRVVPEARTTSPIDASLSALKRQLAATG